MQICACNNEIFRFLGCNFFGVYGYIWAFFIITRKNLPWKLPQLFYFRKPSYCIYCLFGFCVIFTLQSTISVQYLHSIKYSNGTKTNLLRNCTYLVLLKACNAHRV
jgi:hypothetical protein